MQEIIDSKYLRKYNTVIYWLPKSAPKTKRKTLKVVGVNKNGIRKEVLR